MSFDIEKDWTTAAGFRAVVIRRHNRNRCGYVGVPPEHPLHGVAYYEASPCLRPLTDDEPIGKRGVLALLAYSKEEGLRPDIAFDVHGSLTFAGDGDYPVENDGLWWFGFDCNHSGDASTPEEDGRHGNIYRSLEYCVDECESLARQLVERVETVPS